MNSELKQWITNIPRNGEWTDSNNLSVYLSAGRRMERLGFAQQEILKILTALFKAAAAEEREGKL